MRTTTKVLFAVVRTNEVTEVVKPKLYDICGSDTKAIRIPLTETIEDAILVTYPNLNKESFKKISFKVYHIEVGKRHRVITPKSLEKRHGFPHAIELGEYSCFRTLRMNKLGEVSIKKANSENEEVWTVDKVTGKEKLIGVRYGLI